MSLSQMMDWLIRTRKYDYFELALMSKEDLRALYLLNKIKCEGTYESAICERT